MKVAFTTLGCPEWKLDQIARHANEYGYEGIELRTADDGEHMSPDVSLEEARRIAKLFGDAGAPVISILGYSRFASREVAEVEKNRTLLRKHIALAQAMRAPFIRAYAGQLPKGSTREEMAKTVAEAVGPLAGEAVKAGTKILLETHDDWCAGAAMMQIVGAVNSPGLGVLFDIFNSFHSKEESWDKTYAQIKRHVGYCHVKDGYYDRQGKMNYVMLGAGDLPMEAIAAQMKKDGFAGFMSLEWEKKWHPELEPPERIFPQFPCKMRAIWKAA